jgi:hypothetical protein
MAWCYEIRGAENRVLEVRYGFVTQKEARIAGQRAKRMIECLSFPDFEPLTLLAKEDLSALNHLVEMPAERGGWLNPEHAAEGAVALKYPWQKCVVDAFTEPDPDNVPGKINIAERAISGRLLDPAPCDLDERLALGESLLALRQLLREITKAKEDSAGQDSHREDMV